MKQQGPDNRHNAHGQEIGYPVANWTARALPGETPMIGRFARVERLSLDAHLDDIWAAIQTETTDADWTYSPPDQPRTRSELEALLLTYVASPDPLFHAIVDVSTNKAVGWATFMRMDPAMGVIEVGNIRFTPLLQQTRAGTEAMFLMMTRAFDELGYRRYEWKCHSLNAPSRAAALRYGFTYEGTHRQAMVLKGNNRDTSWYSILDSEWPDVRAAFEGWLSDANFDDRGQQRQRLQDIRAKVAANRAT